MYMYLIGMGIKSAAQPKNKLGGAWEGEWSLHGVLDGIGEVSLGAGQGDRRFSFEKIELSSSAGLKDLGEGRG